MLESSLEFAADGTLQVATPLYAQVMLESKGGTAKRRIYAICSALSVNLADSEYGPPGPAEVICAAASPRSQRLKTTSRSSGRMRG
ncbi:two component sensor kinase [Bordetella pertussis]|nr:two component sensor kinase [Bordetella pertussis]CFW29657.1 two component sensor kinase [Bordetella pertussis]CPM84695.1 two component sensor kinase [Bordetella pertussis]